MTTPPLPPSRLPPLPLQDDRERDYNAVCLGASRNETDPAEANRFANLAAGLEPRWGIELDPEIAAIPPA